MNLKMKGLISCYYKLLLSYKSPTPTFKYSLLGVDINHTGGEDLKDVN